MGGGPPAASTSRPGGPGPAEAGSVGLWPPPFTRQHLGSHPRLPACTLVVPAWRAVAQAQQGGAPAAPRGHPVAHRASLVGSGDLGPTESVQELTGAEPRMLSAERAVSGGADAANPSGSGLTAGHTWDEATLKFPRRGVSVGRKKDPGPHPGSACCQPCGFGGDLAPAVPRFPHPLLESCYGEGFDV